MRKLVALPKADAVGLVGFLQKHKIEAAIRESDYDAPANVMVWIIDESKLEQAKNLVEQYMQEQNKESYRQAGMEVLSKLENNQKKKKIAHKVKMWRGDVRYRFIFDYPFTFLFFVLTTLCFIVQLSPPLFSLVFSFLAFEHNLILSGQLWRIVTPIFMHGGILHYAFNMIWLFYLGKDIELLEGRLYYVILTLVFAACVNTAQYLVSGPNFLGYSGVIYGFLGYIWIMARYQDAYRYDCSDETVFFMVAWIFLAMFFFENIATMEHFVGMILGVIWGLLRARSLNRAMRH